MKPKMLQFLVAPTILIAIIGGSPAANAAQLQSPPDLVVNNPADHVPGLVAVSSSGQALFSSRGADQVPADTIALAQPNISIRADQSVFEVQGQNFTPGGKVELQVVANYGVDPVVLTEELTAAASPRCQTQRQCAEAVAPGTIRFATTANLLQSFPCGTRIDAVAVDETDRASDLASTFWCPV